MTEVQKTPESKTLSPQTLGYVSVASAIGIVLVVLGHSLPPHLLYPEDDQFAKIATSIISFIYTFHMPLFFSISGFLYAHTNVASRRRSYGNLMLNKAVRLLLPYVVLGSLAFVPKLLLAEFAKNPIEPSFSFYLDTILYPWNNSIRFFWFLPTLFFIFMIAPIMLRCMNFPSLWGSRLAQFTVFAGVIGLNLNFQHYVEPATLLNYTGVFHNII